MDFTTYEPRISALEAGGGGGGSSDFSTISVQISNNATKSFNLAGNTLYNGAMYPILNSDDLDGSNVDVVSYKGHAELDLYAATVNFSITATGNIKVFDLAMRIDGPGTITISDRE